MASSYTVQFKLCQIVVHRGACWTLLLSFFLILCFFYGSELIHFLHLQKKKKNLPWLCVFECCLNKSFETAGCVLWWPWPLFLVQGVGKKIKCKSYESEFQGEIVEVIFSLFSIQLLSICLAASSYLFFNLLINPILNGLKFVCLTTHH